MGKYFALFNASIQDALAYRGSAVFWLLGNLVAIAMMISVWLSSNTGQLIGTYSKNELITYYIVSIALIWLTNWLPLSWTKEEIKSGDIISNTLLKPVSYYFRVLMNEAAWHTIYVFWGLFVAILLFLIFKNNFVNLLTVNIFLLIIPSLLISIIIVFTFNLCLGMLAFWLTEIDVVADVFWAALGLLGGQIIPLTFFPDSLRWVVNILPFRYMFSFPLELYFNKLTSFQIFEGFTVAFIWCLVLLLIYKLMWLRGVKKYSAWGH